VSSKLDIAKKLAEITGKPITDFFNGEINEEEVDSEGSQIKNKSESVSPACEIGSDKSKSPNIKQTVEKESNVELIEYQKMFEGSKIVNKTIMGGRQMTRKEYLKIVRNMTKTEFYNHPLIYKIFRAEGQVEASFTLFQIGLKMKIKTK